MRIDIVNNAEGFSEEKLNGLDEFIVKLSEAVLSGDYSSPQVTRTLRDAYVTLTFVTPEEIKEINKEQRDIDKVTAAILRLMKTATRCSVMVTFSLIPQLVRFRLRATVILLSAKQCSSSLIPCCIFWATITSNLLMRRS